MDTLRQSRQRTTQIEENNFLTPKVENRNRFAFDILKELVALGNDTDDRRRLLGVYADLVARYETQSDEITYHHLLSDPLQAVTTPEGAIVYPWDVQPGKWLFVPDFLVGRATAASDDLGDDPRNLFIEGVTYTSPWGLSVSGGSDDRLSQLLAKLTYTGGI